MIDKSKVYEEKLYDIWKSQSFNSDLKTVTGDDVTVLDCGVMNEDTAGPDFKNARIRIGNLVYVGDIEIDCDYQHWKAHGHNIDNKHNKVILHASYLNTHNQQYVYTKDGRRVPTVCLSRFVNTDMFQGLKQTLKTSDKSNSLKCAHTTADVEYKIKKEFISQLGFERFKKKCDRVYNRLKELAFLKQLKINEPIIRYDLKPEFDEKKFNNEDFRDKSIWEQLLFEMVFEALGYSQNKSIMLKLAQSVRIDFLKDLSNEKDFLVNSESALFNIGGIGPKLDDASKAQSEYITKIEEAWESIKKSYDGKTFDETDWHFYKLRPQNFPTVRIAGGTRFLKSLLYENLLSDITKKFIEIRNLNILANSLRSLFVIKSDGYWRKHYIFEKSTKEPIKYFVGAGRADEIVVNVVLPYFSVYFDMFSKGDLAKKVVKTYNVYVQRSDNKIVREVADALDTPEFLKKTVMTQGMLELFRNFCSKKRCLECEIGKTVFN